MKDLVEVEKLEIVAFFTKGDQVVSILERLTEEANSYVAGDLSVKKNRDAVKAMVTKFTKSKTYLESKGKELAAEYKAIPKAIDANRKLVKDTITELQEVVRKPLTDWEDEQKAIEAAKQAEIEAAELAKQKDIDHEMALLLDDKFNQEAKAELVRIEQERIAYEAQLAANAAAEATRTAETKALEETQRIEAEKAEAIRKEQRAILEKEQSEQREKQAIIDLENAEKEKVIQAEQAEARRISDIETAKQQQIAAQKEEEARLAVEQQARDEDVENQRVVNQSAVAALLLAGIDSGLTEDQAKIVVKAIIKGQIPNVKLTY